MDIGFGARLPAWEGGRRRLATARQLDSVISRREIFEGVDVLRGVDVSVVFDDVAVDFAVDFALAAW